MKNKLGCVLLVDDDEATNFLHSLIIKRAGCADRIQVSQTAQEALSFLAAGMATQQGAEAACVRPDLILLDINMPGLNGWDFLEEYQKMPIEGKEEIKIVMLSNSFNPDDRNRALSIGEVAGFENKALTFELIDQIMQKHFTAA